MTTPPDLRPEVVALLADIDMESGRHPREWTHHDGRALARDELAVIGTATDAELTAFARAAADAREAEDAQLDLIEELLELVEPYLATLPATARLDDVVPLLDDEQRTTYSRIVTALLATETADGCCAGGECRPPAPGPVPVEIGAAP